MTSLLICFSPHLSEISNDHVSEVGCAEAGAWVANARDGAAHAGPAGTFAFFLTPRCLAYKDQKLVRFAFCYTTGLKGELMDIDGQRSLGRPRLSESAILVPFVSLVAKRPASPLSS